MISNDKEVVIKVIDLTKKDGPFAEIIFLRLDRKVFDKIQDIRGKQVEPIVCTSGADIDSE